MATDTPVQEDHADIDAKLEAEEQPLHEEGVFIFQSKSRLLRLVRIRGYDQPTPAGNVRVPGLVYEFAGGYLRVGKDTHKRDERFFEEMRGRASEKEMSYIDTRPAEEWLRDHPLFNLQENGGFVEITHEPQKPDPSKELVKIAELSAQGNEKALADLYKAEESGHDREPVKEAIIASLRAIETRQAETEQARE